MLNTFILGKLEEFLRREGKKSLSEYRDSAASQKLYWEASILEHIENDSKKNNCDQDLVRAAGLGCAQVVSLLLDAGADKDTIDEDNATPLILAASRGYLEVVELLLKAGANKEIVIDELWLNSNDCLSGTVLMCAAEVGHTAVVEVLLRAGAEVNAVNDFNRTALMVAAKNDHASSVQVLLKAGAYIEAEDSEGWTALMNAAEFGYNTESAKLLLSVGANIEAVDYHGNTALMRAAHTANAAMVEVLLKAGAYIEAVNSEGYTALSFTFRTSETYIAKSSEIENTMKVLISYGANPFLRVGVNFINNNPVNPLAGYSEEILNGIALSEHTEDFCAVTSTDSPVMKVIKADLSKRCSRMNVLRSIYQQELDCYQSTCALNTTARHIHRNYDTKKSVGHNLNGVEVDRPQTRQYSDVELSRNRRDSALRIVSLNMFFPIKVNRADDANKKQNASEARARFFSSVRERMAAKYQAVLLEKQLVPSGDVVEFTAIESEAVLQKIEASINQKKHRKDAISLAP